MVNILKLLHTSIFRIKYAHRSRLWSRNNTIEKAYSDIIISGYLDEPFGIGRAGLLTETALKSLGYRTTRKNLRHSERGLLTQPPIRLPEAAEGVMWLIHANPPEARIALFNHAEEDWRKLYRVGYWAWESDLAPRDWLDVACFFNEIWVPSNFVFEAFDRAFRLAGKDDLVSKLRIVPHPVDVPSTMPKRQASKALRVLTMFDPKSSFERKNPAGAIQAWIMAFHQPSEDRVLIVKSLNNVEKTSEFVDLMRLANNRSDILFLNQTLDHKGQSNLLQNADILLSLHRSEGFGLSLAEAMATGCVVIATEGTGNADFMTDENSILIPGQKKPAGAAYNGPKALWMEPDIQIAAIQLRALANDSPRRRKLARRAHKDMLALREGWRLP